jgi:hypothetical protein
MERTITPEEVLDYARQLSPREQLALVEGILADLAPHLPEVATETRSRSLLGFWQGFSITEDDIAEARQEMWGSIGERGF